MEKLQEGDYVKDLTLEQFMELAKICNAKLSYSVSCLYDSLHLSKSVLYNGSDLDHAKIAECKNELTFSEFKQRAINTFQNAN